IPKIARSGRVRDDAEANNVHETTSAWRLCRPCTLLSGFLESLLAESLLFGPVSAHLPFTPPSAFVLCDVEKEPTTVPAGTLLHPRQICLAQQGERRKRNWSKHGLNRVPPSVPGPHIGPAKSPKVGRPQALRMRVSELIKV